MFSVLSPRGDAVWLEADLDAAGAVLAPGTRRYAIPPVPVALPGGGRPGPAPLRLEGPATARVGRPVYAARGAARGLFRHSAGKRTEWCPFPVTLARKGRRSIRDGGWQDLATGATRRQRD